MGRYYDEHGNVVETSDTWAQAHGYTPVTTGEEAARLGAEARASRGEDRGATGTFNAFGTRVLSGATLGATDALLGATLSDDEREQLLAEIGAHPIASAAGDFVGAIAPAFAAPESALARTPTGYLANATARATETALAEGGIASTTKALTAMGAEGAIQNGGAYLGHAALENKDVTAEGFTGALGTGFAFGAGGGGAFLGLENGTIAARKMFSRVMDGGRDAEKIAESSWSAASQTALEADAATADVARRRLDEIVAMKDEALRARQAAKSSLSEEQIRRSAAPRPEPFVPEPSPPMATEGGTQIIPRAPKFDEPAVPAPESTPFAPAPVTRVTGSRTGAGENVTPDFTPENAAIPRTDYAEGASLQGQGRGDFAMRQMEARAAAPAPTAERTGIRGMLDELDAFKNSEKPLSAFAGAHSFADARHSVTTELLGKGVADEELKLLEALHEFQNAKNEFVDKIVAGDGSRYFSPKVPDEFAMPSKTSTPATPEQIVRMRHEGLQNEGTAVGKKRALEILDNAHENALERAQRASDPAERDTALQQAAELEKVLERLAPPAVQKSRVPADFLAEVDQHAKVIDRYEQSSSKLADAVGEAAHPASQGAAKAYAEAGDEAVRKASDRTARAVEDHEAFGPFQYAGPEYKTPKERVTYARERLHEANNAHTAISNDERVAKKVYGDASAKVKAGESARKAALKVDAKAAKAAAKSSQGMNIATAIGGAAEIANIPGLPKASDLPVVGPLLGAWLKYRAVKMALGRVGGTVPALADSSIAALASRTKDRVARAVDRSIGLTSKLSKIGYKVTPLLSGAVTQRIYDDGDKTPSKDAGIQEHVAARTRELAAYVNTPGAIENDVRKQLGGVSDPDTIAAVEKQRRAIMEYLLKNAPKTPLPGPLQKVNYLPSPAQAMSFARRLEAADDPAGVYERLAAEQAQISLEAAETLRTVYPQLFALGQQRLLERAPEIKQQVPYAQRVRMSLVYQLPLDSAMDPANLKITQSVYERSITEAPGAADAATKNAPPAPPVPSIAQPTNLMPMYQNPYDRQR